MRKFNTLLTLAVAIVLLALPAAAPLAEEAADEAFRQQVVQRFSQGTGAAAHLARLVRKALLEAKPSPAGDPRDFVNELTEEKVERRIVPVLARHLSTAEASEIDRYLKSKEGAKLVAEFSAVLRRAPLPGDPTRPSAADRRVADRFALTAASRHWAAAQKRADADLAAMWRTWMTEVVTTRQVETLGRLLADPEAPITTGEPAEAIEFLRSFARILRDVMQDMQRANEEYQTAAANAGLAERTTPKMLAAPEQVAASRQAIVRLQDALTTRQRVVESLLEDATRRIREMPAPNVVQGKQFVQGIERAMERNYAFFLEFGENQRRLLDLFDRIFVLAETHQRNLTVQDGKLIFPDNESLATFRDLARQLGEEADRETALIDKARQSVHPALRQGFDAAQNSHAGR